MDIKSLWVVDIFLVIAEFSVFWYRKWENIELRFVNFSRFGYIYVKFGFYYEKVRCRWVVRIHLWFDENATLYWKISGIFFRYHGEFYVFWEKRNKRKCKLSCFTKYGLLEILFGCLIFNESVKHFSYDTEKSNQHAWIMFFIIHY